MSGMIRDSGPDKGQASRLAVAAVMIALVFAAMALIGPLLSPEQPGQSRLPPLIQVLMSR
jgi:hypothetical protein